MAAGASQPPDLRDREQFARVASEHGRSLYATALAILHSPADAQDVVQDVLLRIWCNPSAFDARRGSLGAYLQLLARSRAIDLARTLQAGRRASERAAAAAGAGATTGAPSPADEAVRADDRRELHAALRELPPEQREAVVLAYWGDLTASEIAHSTRVPVGTVKSRVRLGLRKLAAVQV